MPRPKGSKNKKATAPAIVTPSILDPAAIEEKMKAVEAEIEELGAQLKNRKVFFARAKSKKLQRKIQRVALYFPHSYGSRFGNFLGQNPLLSISSYGA